jgi:hypothetical protein
MPVASLKRGSDRVAITLCTALRTCVRKRGFDRRPIKRYTGIRHNRRRQLTTVDIL